MVSVIDLDQFEEEVLALLSDLRVDESVHTEQDARRLAYIATARKHGFL